MIAYVCCQVMLWHTCVLHACMCAYKYACSGARMYGGYVYVVRLCVRGVRAAHCRKSCTLPITNLALANRTTNQQPTYPIAYQGTLKYQYYYCMYVILDESSTGHQRHQIEQYIFFGYVPTYALIWRCPYPWMNVGNLCPGVNMKPPPCQGFVHMVGPCILRILLSGAIQL